MLRVVLNPQLGRVLNCPKGFIFGGAGAQDPDVLKYSEDSEHRTTSKMGPFGQLRHALRFFILFRDVFMDNMRLNTVSNKHPVEISNITILRDMLASKLQDMLETSQNNASEDQASLNEITTLVEISTLYCENEETLEQLEKDITPPPKKERAPSAHPLQRVRTHSAAPLLMARTLTHDFNIRDPYLSDPYIHSPQYRNRLLRINKIELRSALLQEQIICLEAIAAAYKQKKNILGDAITDNA